MSKLANLALPADNKDMLEDPETKGSTHNTGNAVDGPCPESGEELDMGCGFDEPSLRQYASYAGGTSRERYLRSLLREEMCRDSRGLRWSGGILSLATALSSPI